jgi:hypothetical protein
MVKRANDQTHQKPSSNLRVRWVEVEVNGADTTIEEALRAVERMRRPVIEVAPPRRVGHVPAAHAEDAPPPQPTLFDEQEEMRDNGAEQGPPLGPVGNIDEPSGSPRKRRGDGDRRDRNAGLKPVGNIDFVPAGKPSLNEFFTAKAPSSDLDQILVICFFLEHTLETNQIGPGHVLSGLKHLEKPVPKDLKQTIRNVEKKAWLRFTDIEDIHLTTEGDNRVKFKLGQGNGDAGVK